jgi:beta-glucosidase
MNGLDMVRRALLSGLMLMLPGILTASCQVKEPTPAYRDSGATIDKRVNDLLSRMTLEEKIAQLQCTTKKIEWGKNLTEKGLGGVGPILRPLAASAAARQGNEIQTMAIERSRLHIPVLFHDEALHGLIATGVTSFPQAIGLAATWDPDLVAQIGSAIGKETRSRGIRQVLSPVVNIARDVRWGRIGETYGEDPFLQSRIAVAFCKSIESEGVVTTPKHFVANFGDGGRDSYPVHLSERELREVYFPPFEACIREAGAGSVMAAYNALNDIPCSADSWLLTQVLRKEWGFHGIVVSDYGSVAGIREKHFVARDAPDAAAQAVQAGLDMELPDIQYYGTPLLEAARGSASTTGAVDEAVRNVLRTKFRLGLFEQPYADPEVAEAMNNSKEHRALARRAGREAIVLLKNDRSTLPLKKDLRSIAVIGPCADSVLLGDYSGYGMKVVTLREGVAGAVSSATSVRYEKGCDVGFDAPPPIPAECLMPAGGNRAEHGLRAEYYDNQNFSGAPRLVRVDRQIQFTWAMGSPDSLIPRDHFSVRWTGRLTPVQSGRYKLGASTDDGVRLWLDGRLLIDHWFERGATLDMVPVKLEAGRAYDIRIDYYENAGWSYAALVWQRITENDPRRDAAVDAARHADAAVIAVGIIEGEGYDRSHLDLVGGQEELIRTVAATGTPTVVVLFNGSAVTMANWIEEVPAVIEAWYPGEEGGNALADVLFGACSPGGKLPLTFPQYVGQVPLYYNTKPTGRGDDYSDMSGKPLFPFGHGLSYTTFTYSNLRITPERIDPDGSVRVSVDIRNTGTRTGDEVVQVYTHDPIASVTRPVKELKGFKRVTLAAGDKETVTFTLARAELSFLDRQMKRVVEPGVIEVMMGSSSEDIRERGSFVVVARSGP